MTAIHNPNLLNLSRAPTVVMIRHGETESNQSIHEQTDQIADPSSDRLKKINPCLSSLGHLQSETVGKHLDEILGQTAAKFHVWYSPLTRTQQTAAPFLHFSDKRRLLSIKTEPLLQECIKPGTEISDELKERGVTTRTWDQYLSDVRTLNKKIRVQLALMKENEHLLIFGHSLTISLCTSYMLINNAEIDVPVSVEVPNCSITTGRYDEGRWRLFHIGSVAHLSREISSGLHTLWGTRS